MKPIHVLLTLATSLFLACGDDGGSTTPDAPPAANCFVEPSYAVTTLGGPAAVSAGGMSADIPGEVLAGGRLQEIMPPDLLALELFATFGVFANNGNQITPGTYAIEGLELNYQSCGLCVRILTDVDMEGNSSPAGDAGYLATGGSVTINSINPNVSFTLTDITFEHVNIADDFNSSPHPDGCQTAVPTLTFDAPVMYMPPMAAQGDADQPGAGWPSKSRYVRK